MIIDASVAGCNKRKCDLQHNLYNMNPIDKIISVFAPNSCAGCGLERGVICMECMDLLDTLPSICYVCGKATAKNVACDVCQKRYQPSRVWMFTAYKGLAKDIITSYKFDQKREAAASIARCIDTILPYYDEPPVVTFVPTATNHRRSRGFDHAELIAKEVARLRNWQYWRTLNRISQLQQHGETRQTRINQLKGVFVPTNLPAFHNKRILIIDDVLTTGATITECSRTLYKSGALMVEAAVFSRTQSS